MKSNNKEKNFEHSKYPSGRMREPFESYEMDLKDEKEA